VQPSGPHVLLVWSKTPLQDVVRQLLMPVCQVTFVVLMQVVCGLDHTLAVSGSGKVYAFGDNSLCQLGRAGSMGVQMGADPDAWIIQDEEGHDITFAKVTTLLCHAVGSAGHDWNLFPAVTHRVF